MLNSLPSFLPSPASFSSSSKAEADVFTFPPFLIVYPLKAVYSDDDVGALKFSLGVAWNMSLESNDFKTFKFRDFASQSWDLQVIQKYPQK